ncbi:MAG: phosphopantothenoylcysteine decarboxylase [Candidatus Omnitrophica bacterium]|nr:phosphopantothenoylcysteine decarboxylase [Candidatus Omnitrophota bacterium]
MLKNKKVLITCGPTWVPIDEVRVISNVSSGQMGHILASAFLREGCQVTLIEGPVHQPMTKTEGLKVIPFFFYEELRTTLLKKLKQKFDIVIHAAAVSDYRIKNTFNHKISSSLKTLKLILVPTAKIITEIKKIQPKCFLVGFKLEPGLGRDALIDRSRKLFSEAGCDLVIANSLRGNKYKGYIIDPQLKVAASADSREGIVKKLIQDLKKS